MDSTKSSASSAHPSTRHHRCDEAFLELLEEDFGIPVFALNNAFMGCPRSPKCEAIALCEWAAWRSPDNPDRALLAWARKNSRGTFRADGGRHRRALGRGFEMCQKHGRRCDALLEIREEALAEWTGAETYSDVCRAWGRLGGRVTLHRYGRGHFAELARRRSLGSAPLR